MKKGLIGLVGTAISAMGMVVSTEQLDHIISIICSVAGVIIVIATSVIIPLVSCYKKAKADGKITKEEVEEAKDIVSKGVGEVKDAIDKLKTNKERRH